MRKKIYHVDQNVVEYYEYKYELHTWLNINKDVGDDWLINSFRYIELRHNNDMKYNLYGMYSMQ